MKKRMMIACLVVTFFVLGAASAAAVENGVIKVGLRYGSSVLDAANLENAVGEGYAFGYFDQSRRFVPLEETGERTITMSPSGWGTIQVTVTGTDQVLYESDGDSLGVMPLGFGEEPVTWFKGYRYTGGFEYTLAGGGVQVVNVTDLENYVKGVVPDEMSGNWPLAALEAQAVCARTYAYQELSAYAYPDCEAHVDDSVSFQVYGNTGRTAGTDRAVAETAGQILTCQGSPITAYYFSTSCGATGNQEVWWDGDQTATPYLAGKTVDAAGEAVDLSKEEEFNAFLEADHPDGYDADISWYRWETEIDNKTLSENLNQALAGRIAANPNAVLTRLGSRLESRTIKTIGRIRGIDVLERNEGGAVTKLQIRGSRHTIEVSTEYNARALLNVQGGSIRRRDGSRVEGGMLLPSACMRITPLFDEKGELSGWRFTGGGYGHGVGLSQNGANGMAKQGKGYGEILHFFYTDVELTDIREM